MPSRELQMMADIANRPVEEFERVTDVYPFALTPFLAQRAREGTYSHAALRQFMPDVRELIDYDGYTVDPAGEQKLQPERAIIRTYDNRLAIILSYQCLVYCRFCFRKEYVGRPGHNITQDDLQRALGYVGEHPEVEDVLLSGGDPLALPNRRLIPFLEELTSIPHVRVVRLDSRAISVHPQRIDDDLVRFLGTKDQFWYYGHMNHPDDIDHPEVVSAVRRLQSARVPVLNQCVILGGVNDDPATMARLMMLCYVNKVIPYNLYVLDRVKGGAHFDVPAERVVEIYKGLAHLPGPAQPALVWVDNRERKHRALNTDGLDLREFLLRRDNVPVG